jgi:UDP-N-acetylglucosamine 2-epimerase
MKTLIVVGTRPEAIKAPLIGVRKNEPKIEAKVCVAAHRRKNLRSDLDGVCAAQVEIARGGDVEIVFQVPVNSQVKHPVHRMLGEVPGYLMGRTSLVITDLGGVS